MHANYIASLLMQNWKSLYPDQTSCPGLFYVDMWPIAPPIIFSETLFPNSKLLMSVALGITLTS